MIESQLTTLGLLFLFSIVGGLLAARFKQPVVLGLMVIGALIGPNLLGIVSDAEMIDLVVEFGAILFLFTIGLEFSLRKLMKTGMKSIVVSLFKVGIMFFLGFATIMVLGFDATTAAFMGVAISFSSTMIIMNILKQKDMIKRKEVPLLIAVLVLEDIFGVVALTFFAAMKKTGAAGLMPAMIDLVLSLAILIVIYVVMSKFAENIVKWLTKHAGDEIIPFIALGLCAGFAYIAFALKLSPSAGAFLAGSVVSTFRDSKVFEHSIKPHSFMFTSFFFIAMGTMINFRAIAENWGIILIFSGVIVGGLFLAMGLVSKVFAGFRKDNVLFASLAMLPPGVFSLLVAKESAKFGVPLDLVSIISVLIFVLAISMSVILKYLSRFNARFDAAKPGPLSARIEKLSSYISNFFDEVDLENTFTNKFKRKARKMTGQIMLGMLVFAIAFKVIDWTGASGLLLYALLAVSTIISIGIFSFAYREGKDVKKLAVRILSGLEGGTRVERTSRIITNLQLAVVIFIIGAFSPLLIFALQGGLVYLLLSFMLIMVGLYFFGRTLRLLSGVSMQYKYNVHEYKKVNVKKSYYD